MTLRVAINGFGRIGRLTMRAIAEAKLKNIKVVAINSPSPIETNAHLFQYDSAHGTFQGDVKVKGETLDVGLGPMDFSHIFEPEQLDWNTQNIDIVLECSGKFNSKTQAQAHIAAGAKKVLVSAPTKNADLTVVYGVNHDQITANHNVISNASCTTNCLAPLAKVLHATCGIKHGYMSAIHAYTGDQRLIDSSHKDLRRARTAAASIVPTKTGAAQAIGLVIPELKGRLRGAAIRVPVANVSCVELTFVAENSTSEDEINNAMNAAAQRDLKGILTVNTAPLVSSDFNHNPASAIFDATQTKVTNGSFVHVLAWYDNEWGFSQRMIDTALVIGKHL